MNINSNKKKHPKSTHHLLIDKMSDEPCGRQTNSLHAGHK